MVRPTRVLALAVLRGKGKGLCVCVCVCVHVCVAAAGHLVALPFFFLLATCQGVCACVIISPSVLFVHRSTALFLRATFRTGRWAVLLRMCVYVVAQNAQIGHVM